MLPWWVLVYLTTYMLFAAWAFGFEVQADAEPVGYLVIQGMTDLLLLVAGLAYWSSQLHRQLASVLVPCFALGIVILCWQIIATLRRRPVPTGKWSLPVMLFCGGSGAALWSILSAPLVYWGYRAAILGEPGAG
ncbi:MAG: hypothetical protein ABW110_12440 [Steroidobacteraceae bacterium]